MSSGLPAAPQPLRKGLAIASLVLGVLSIFTLAGLFIGGLIAVVLGIVALVKANRAPAEYGGKGLAIGGIAAGVLSYVMVPMLGIIAAIAIPSLLRARISANEAAAIGDVRTVVSAEVAYQATYGSYDTLECLADPATCASGRTGASAFLDQGLAKAEVKTGYQRRFFPGPAADGAGSGKLAPSAVESFAYVAVPVTRNRTGIRSFCGDSNGTVCGVIGAMPEISEGRCPESCEPLR